MLRSEKGRIKPMETKDSRRRLAYCALFTFVWGMIAHAYGLTNALFSHDSLNALVANRSENIWKLQLGRFLVPVYRGVVRGNIAAPWLLGMLALAFIALAVFLTCEAFEIRSKTAALLLSGIFTANLTVSALVATYNYEFDVDMLAMLLSVLSVYLWRKKKFGFLWGALCVAGSLALYQAFISLALTLCMLVGIKLFAQGADLKDTLRQGLKAIAMLILGGLLYALVLLCVTKIGGISLRTDTYNGLEQLESAGKGGAFRLIIPACVKLFGRYSRQIPAYGKVTEVILNIFVAALGLFLMIHHLIKARAGRANIILSALLLLLLPIGINCVYVLDGGLMHDLMAFSSQCLYVFLIICLFDGKQEGADKTARLTRMAGTVLLAAVLLGDVCSANGLYLKKDLERQATLSYMTRAVDRIERSEGYERGVTSVAVYGVYEQDAVAGFERYSLVTGAQNNGEITVPFRKETFDLYKVYFDTILNCDINSCDIDTWWRIIDSEELAQMPSFPSEGCVRYIDGVLTLKMGDRYWRARYE